MKILLVADADESLGVGKVPDHLDSFPVNRKPAEHLMKFPDMQKNN